MILRMGIRRKVSFVNERPSRFRILIRHQLGRRCHRFQHHTDPGRSRGRKYWRKQASFYFFLSCVRNGAVPGLDWMAVNFQTSPFQIAFRMGSVFQIFHFVSLFHEQCNNIHNLMNFNHEKEYYLAKMSVGIHRAFSRLELLKVNYLLFHKLLSQFLQKTYPGSRNCELSIIFVNQVEAGY